MANNVIQIDAAVSPTTSTAASADPRQVIARRLLAQMFPPTGNVARGPQSTGEASPGGNDEFAPHLGRHLDVVA